MTYYSQNNIEATLPEASNGTAIWVLNKDKSIAQRTVTKGEDDGVNIQILEGVKTGEQVVIGFSETSQEASESADEMDSPFMPKRPDRDNKKATPTK